MSQALENLLTEDRKFEPSPEFAAKAKAKPGIHEDAADDYLDFWHRQALQRITWLKEPTQVLDDSNPPFYRWFAGGRLNTCHDALDRHVDGGRADQPALVYDSPVTETTAVFTYRELRDAVARFAGDWSSSSRLSRLLQP